MAEVGLQLHPAKTRIVYCGRNRRHDTVVTTKFDFLGFTFQNRAARERHGEIFTSFLPAVSKDALKKMSRELRSWRLHMHIGYTFSELARWINPIVRGWMQYYGAFYRTELYPLLRRINCINYYLMRWVRKKFRRLGTFKKFHRRWKQITEAYPLYFATGNWSTRSGDQDDRSPVTGDCHAGICGSPGVRFPRATRPAAFFAQEYR